MGTGVESMRGSGRQRARDQVIFCAFSPFLHHLPLALPALLPVLLRTTVRVRSSSLDLFPRPPFFSLLLPVSATRATGHIISLITPGDLFLIPPPFSAEAVPAEDFN